MVKLRPSDDQHPHAMTRHVATPQEDPHQVTIVDADAASAPHDAGAPGAQHEGMAERLPASEPQAFGVEALPAAWPLEDTGSIVPVTRVPEAPQPIPAEPASFLMGDASLDLSAVQGDPTLNRSGSLTARFGDNGLLNGRPRDVVFFQDSGGKGRTELGETLKDLIKGVLGPLGGEIEKVPGGKPLKGFFDVIVTAEDVSKLFGLTVGHALEKVQAALDVLKVWRRSTHNPSTGTNVSYDRHSPPS